MDKQAVLNQLKTQLRIVEECIQDNQVKLRSLVGIRADDTRYLIHGYQGEREGLQRAIRIVENDGCERE